MHVTPSIPLQLISSQKHMHSFIFYSEKSVHRLRTNGQPKPIHFGTCARLYIYLSPCLEALIYLYASSSFVLDKTGH